MVETFEPSEKIIQPFTIIADRTEIQPGGVVRLQVIEQYWDKNKYKFYWDVKPAKGQFDDNRASEVKFVSVGDESGFLEICVYIYNWTISDQEIMGDSTRSKKIAWGKVDITVRKPQVEDPHRIAMLRTFTQDTEDQSLYVVIKNSTEAISFNNYKHFIEQDLQCWSQVQLDRYFKLPEFKDKATSSLPFPFVDSYRRLKVATELFLMAHCGVVDWSYFKSGQESIRFGHGIKIGEIASLWEKYTKDPEGGKGQMIPYLRTIYRNKLGEISLDGQGVEECHYLLRQKLTNPCLMELIWSYWHEEGCLCQTLDVIGHRFQNRRSRAAKDPLMHLAIDPLRPLSNLMWGHIQDYQHQLQLERRAYEYDHQYGLPLVSQAIPRMTGVDSRSRFLEAFHNLLYVCPAFFQADDDATVMADGFPVLNALKEVHLILAEGAHNQFGDLPSTARLEMLMQMYLLARPEMRDFLRGRIMVPYTEAWMDPVDTMKKLQGWTDVSVMHFNKLAVFGEQLLLSIRYGNWNEVNMPEQAANWARYWRPEIQNYIHSYRAVTGVDLTAEITSPRQANLRYLPPAVHLQNRVAAQARMA